MGKQVRIFKSLEEHEQYHKKLMNQASVEERFRKLYLMQQMNRLLNPVADRSRKIRIRKWTSLEEIKCPQDHDKKNWQKY